MRNRSKEWVVTSGKIVKKVHLLRAGITFPEQETGKAPYAAIGGAASHRRNGDV
jgi:hypothetical protein